MVGHSLASLYCSTTMASWNGQDAWVFAFIRVFQDMLDSSSVTPATLAAYSRTGVPALLTFFREIGCEYTAQAVTKTVVKRFVGWARVNYPNGSAAKTYYQKSKAILTAMIELGMMRVELEGLFPRNPFAGANGSVTSAAVLSETEEQRVAAALKRDLIGMHRGTFQGTNADARVVQLLHIALRTGINTAPLLELRRDAVSPNPLAPGLLTLETMKRRASATHRTSIRKSVQHDDLEVVPMDGAAILNVVLRETDQYLAEAPSGLRNRVWLYKSGLLPVQWTPPLLARVSRNFGPVQRSSNSWPATLANHLLEGCPLRGM